MARVVIVDDNPLIRVALSGIVRLDPNLAVVGESWNGELALAVIESARPDVVCLDVLMPVMDGVAALRRIRTEYPDTRVVMITGMGTPDMVKEVVTLGADGFIVKPFNAAKVLRSIQAAMRTRPASAADRQQGVDAVSLPNPSA